MLIKMGTHLCSHFLKLNKFGYEYKGINRINVELLYGGLNIG
jgi:hypothetical protein